MEWSPGGGGGLLLANAAMARAAGILFSYPADVGGEPGEGIELAEEDSGDNLAKAAALSLA